MGEKSDKVYIVTSEAYSDSGIRGVYLDEGEADKHARMLMTTPQRRSPGRYGRMSRPNTSTT